MTTETDSNSEASAVAGDYLGVDATGLICRAKATAAADWWGDAGEGPWGCQQ